MRKTAGMLLLPLTVAAASFCQQQPVAPALDTTNGTRIIVLDLGLSTGRSTLLVPPAFQRAEAFGDTSIVAIWMKTSVLPPHLGGVLEPKADLTVALRAQWAKDSQLSTLRTVLGAVELGSVAYIAYKALTSKTPKPVKK
jgi:hypothetical protein